MIYLAYAGVVALLVAIFGVMIARLALQQERLGGVTPKHLPKPKDPYALVWWQDLEDLGYEFHLENGEVWRGRLGDAYHRYPDGADESHAVPLKHWDKLSGYRRRIEWREPEIWAKHAHVLVDWAAIDRAYQLKLLNGSVWQFNTKSEGLGENNSLAWHRISSPGPPFVFESINRVHASLNEHLGQIRRGQTDPEMGAGGSPGEAVVIHRHNSLLLVQQAGQLAAAARGVLSANHCDKCHFRPVSIPGGICRACREAQGAGA